MNKDSRACGQDYPITTRIQDNGKTTWILSDEEVSRELAVPEEFRGPARAITSVDTARNELIWYREHELAWSECSDFCIDFHALGVQHFSIVPLSIVDAFKAQRIRPRLSKQESNCICHKQLAHKMSDDALASYSSLAAVLMALAQKPLDTRTPILNAVVQPCVKRSITALSYMMHQGPPQPPIEHILLLEWTSESHLVRSFAILSLNFHIDEETSEDVHEYPRGLASGTSGQPHVSIPLGDFLSHLANSPTSPPYMRAT